MLGPAWLQSFLQELEKMYKAIDLYMLNLQKKLRLKIAEEVKPMQAFEVLKRENAFWKNKNRQENFYFAPSQAQRSFRYLFLDDVNPKRIQGYKAIIVQTSKSKYQAYILLSEEVQAKQLKRIAQEAVKTFQADKSVVWPWHLRRLSGFLNVKYSPAFLITWYKQEGKMFEVNKHTPPQNKWKKVSLRQKGGRVFIKSWQEFAKPYQVKSLSEVDFAYACYLVSLGLDDEEIAQHLLESPDLHMRHKNVQDYLRRTIKAARRAVC